MQESEAASQKKQYVCRSMCLLLSPPALDVRLMTALQVLQVRRLLQVRSQRNRRWFSSQKAGIRSTITRSRLQHMLAPGGVQI